VLRLEPELAGQPDRLRWNARWGPGFSPSFEPHPLVVSALAAAASALPPGPVLELASGPSGSALLLAKAGRPVVVVDVSDVGLGLLAAEAERRGLAALVTAVQADLCVWRPESARYVLVLCTGYWDADLFPSAAQAVVAGGLLGWEAFTVDRMATQPSLPRAWCLEDGEPAALLPARWQILSQDDLPGAKRRLLARLSPPGFGNSSAGT